MARPLILMPHPVPITDIMTTCQDIVRALRHRSAQPEGSDAFYADCALLLVKYALLARQCGERTGLYVEASEFIDWLAATRDSQRQQDICHRSSADTESLLASC